MWVGIMIQIRGKSNFRLKSPLLRNIFRNLPTDGLFPLPEIPGPGFAIPLE